MNTSLARTELVEALRDICEDSTHVSFTSSYSGRGMCGERCVGITGPVGYCMQVVAAVIKRFAAHVSAAALDAAKDNSEGPMDALAEAEEHLEYVVDLLLTEMVEDSMGREVILYWEDLQA